MFCQELNPNHFSFLIEGSSEIFEDFLKIIRKKSIELSLTNFPHNTTIFERNRDN
jgi:hypothetical protein